MSNQTRGWRRLVNAAGYSWQGLNAAWQYEAAFRQEVIVGLIAMIIALLVPVSIAEKLLMIIMVALVLVVELLNSAIEAVVDRTGLDHHPLAGRAKDMGSAAVLVTVLLAAGVWLVILLTL